MVTRIRAALLLALARVGALVAPPSLRRRPAPRQATAVQDLSGDGGVLCELEATRMRWVLTRTQKRLPVNLCLLSRC